MSSSHQSQSLPNSSGSKGGAWGDWWKEKKRNN